MHSAHIGDNHHAVTLIADMQFAIFNLRIAQRTEIQKIVIQTSIAQPLRRSKCAIGCSVGICLHRLGGIHQRNVADVVALTEQVAHTFGVLQPTLHMGPIGHTEVETGRCPLPPSAVCRVVQAVHTYKVSTRHKVVVNLLREPLARTTPTHTMEGLEPRAGTIVEVSDRTRHLGLNET